MSFPASVITDNRAPPSAQSLYAVMHESYMVQILFLLCTIVDNDHLESDRSLLHSFALSRSCNA